jgi:DNA polymerase-3 subunit delta
MKLAAARIGTFLKDPGACRVVLLHGDDAGLIRDRAETVVRSVAGSLDDPFLIADLNRETFDRLAEEASALSMTGGRRVVRLREATDAATDRIAAILKSGSTALIVIEAPGLASKAKLKALIEAAADGAAIACYPEEGRDLEQTIRAVLTEAGVTVENDALTWLTSQLGADRASTHREIEKLAMYAGPGGRVDLDAAMECVGDLAGLSLDDALFAATAGDIATTDRALELAIAEGASAVGVIRGGMMHLQRLHRVRLAMTETGASAADATRSARPPVFFRRQGAFARALTLWQPEALAGALAFLSEAERACKRTGAPDITLCRNAVLTLARRAAGRR